MSDPVRPLTPRPRLLLGLVIILALWIAAMIVMYFKTVYPHRHPLPSRPVQSTG
jgi:hypothetical protein